ncbi:MAG TPA: hypothetical protein VFR33_06555 [Candidatus Dormibacteraeota bacterium]|nr:hypothetical protein [Candidatus Dormibacteraeota bacterium]
MPTVLRLLAEEMRLQRKYVVEHPIDAPAFEAMVRDHARMVEMATKRRPERAIDASLPPDLSLLEQLQAPVEGELS